MLGGTFLIMRQPCVSWYISHYETHPVLGGTFIIMRQPCVRNYISHYGSHPPMQAVSM